MARTTSTYVCQSCGAQTRQFFGRCSSCGSWNSLVEQSTPASDNRRRRPVAVADAESEIPAAPRRSALAGDPNYVLSSYQQEQLWGSRLRQAPAG